MKLKNPLSGVERKARRMLEGSPAQRKRDEMLDRADKQFKTGKISKETRVVLKRLARLSYKCALLRVMHQLLRA